MPNERDDINQALESLGKSKADLCRETGIEYKRLSGICNGYWWARPTEDRQIRQVLSTWRETQQVKEAAA